MLVNVLRLGPPDFRELAALRLEHQQGVPQVEPTHWVGARRRIEGYPIVAALGWIEEKLGMRMVVEIDRTPDRWGKIGALVLVQSIIDGSRKHGIRVQAMVLPSNDALKKALLHPKVNARCVLEIWEPETGPCP